MFIAQALKPHNDFWKYIVGSVIVIVASVVGQLPLGLALIIKSMQDGKPMPTENEIFRYMDLNLTLFLLLLSFAVAFIALILVVRALHGQKVREVVTARPKVDWKRIFFSFTLWGVFSAASVVALYFIEPESYVLQFNAPKFLILLVIAVVMIPIQTSAEELMFRGYLMQGFGVLAKNKWFPLLLTSIIFGGMHIFNPEVAKMGISCRYITLAPVCF